jgi:hypothetical protein
MALGDTGRAIGAVTEALRVRLGDQTVLNLTPLTVTVGRPETDQGARRLNLFLYEIVFDAHMKNTPLDDGLPAPVWLVLKYMMTAFDELNESDTVQAHEFLGQGVRALQELNYLTAPAGLSADYIRAMTPNPEDLKITFDDSSSDLLSKVMQGSNERYRVSVSFQVRPILIAPAEPASYSLLVGIDYTTTPQTVIGEDGVAVQSLPSLGPVISRIEPEVFELEDVVTVHGTDLNLDNLSVLLGPVELPVTMQQPDRLQFVARGDLLTGERISAGGQPLMVVQAVTATRRRRSNMLVGNLLPTLAAVAVVSPAPVLTPPPGRMRATLALNGLLLGNDTDDVLIVLNRDGTTVRVMDYFMLEADIPAPPPPPPVPAQTRKRIEMTDADGVTPGDYRVILRVNGLQAKQSPVITFV